MPYAEVYKYNPRETPQAELEATFVARQPVLEDLLRDLRERANAPTNQHALIIGPRGIGKTNLLLMIRYAVGSDEALANAYIPLQTAEEEYSIASLRDLFAKILSLLIEKEPDSKLVAAIETIEAEEDDEHAAERAIEAARAYANHAGKKLLLLADNLHLILDEQISDDAELGRLRDVLMNDSFLVLIGAAPTYFKEVSGHERPFFNFFRVIELDDFSAEQMTELLRRRAEQDDNRTLLEHMDEAESRVKAIHHLTGGNPRLGLMLYQLCTAGELPEVRTAVHALLDDVTPYYKHRLEALAPQGRRVLDTFARLGRPATPTELAEETRLSVNQINAVLQRLKERGFVTVGPQKRRKKTYYMVSERLFRIWHQMRFTPSRRRLQFLIDFIRVWYTLEGWAQETDRLLGEYRAIAAEGRFADAEPHLIHLGYMAAAAPSDAHASAALEATIAAAIDSGDFEHAESILEERRNLAATEGHEEQLAQAWFLTGELRYHQGRLEDVIEALRQVVALEPNCHEALYNWGLTLAAQAREKAGEDAERLLESACAKYKAAVEVKPDEHDAFNNWGAALTDLAKLRSGEERAALLDSAREKLAQAIRHASAAGAEDVAALYRANFAHGALLQCASFLEDRCINEVRQTFAEVVERLPGAQEDEAVSVLGGFFLRLAHPETAPLLAELLDVLRERGLDRFVGELEPFARAAEYWQKGDDAEVLDRLNPEVREIVEEIIRRGEEREESPQEAQS
jgi:DNA-binding MarR family transcriptional regulator